MHFRKEVMKNIFYQLIFVVHILLLMCFFFFTLTVFQYVFVLIHIFIIIFIMFKVSNFFKVDDGTYDWVLMSFFSRILFPILKINSLIYYFIYYVIMTTFLPTYLVEFYLIISFVFEVLFKQTNFIFLALFNEKYKRYLRIYGVGGIND
jgi:hypothetical protein